MARTAIKSPPNSLTRRPIHERRRQCLNRACGAVDAAPASRVTLCTPRAYCAVQASLQLCRVREQVGGRTSGSGLHSNGSGVKVTSTAPMVIVT